MKNLYIKATIIFILAFALSAGSSFALTTYLYSPESGGPLTPIATPGIGVVSILTPPLPAPLSAR